MDDTAIRRELDSLNGRIKGVEQHMLRSVEEVAELRGLREDIVELRQLLTAEVDRVHARINTLRQDWQRGREADAARREDERGERKKDRQWALTAVFAATALILTGVGIMVSTL